MQSSLLTALCPRQVTAIHMRSVVALCSMAKTRLTGGDQPLDGLTLIGKATLNVLESAAVTKSPLLKKSDLTSVTSTLALARKSRASVSSEAVNIFKGWTRVIAMRPP